MKLAILGRGKSVLEFEKCSSQFPRVYLVNKFDEELEAIGTEKFLGKSLVHVQGPAYDHSLTLEHYYLFKPVEIVRNNSKITPVMMQRGYIATTNWGEILAKSKEEPNHQALISRLNEEHEEQLVEWEKQRPGISGRVWPTIGMFAIEYALVVNKPDELHLFGFDFYESDYVHEKVKHSKMTPILANMMRYHVEALVSEFSHVEFTITTASKTFRPQYPNCSLTFV